MYLLRDRYYSHDLICKCITVTVTIKSPFAVFITSIHSFIQQTLTKPRYVLGPDGGTGSTGNKPDERIRALVQIICAHDTFNQSPLLRSPQVWFLLGTHRAPLSSCPGCHSLLRACCCFLPPPNPPFTLHTLCNLHPREPGVFISCFGQKYLPSSCHCAVPPSALSSLPEQFCLTPRSSRTVLQFLNNSFRLVIRVASAGQIQLVNVYLGQGDVILAIKRVRYEWNWENFRTPSLSHSLGRHGLKA